MYTLYQKLDKLLIVLMELMPATDFFAKLKTCSKVCNFVKKNVKQVFGTKAISLHGKFFFYTVRHNPDKVTTRDVGRINSGDSCSTVNSQVL